MALPSRPSAMISVKRSFREEQLFIGVHFSHIYMYCSIIYTTCLNLQVYTHALYMCRSTCIPKDRGQVPAMHIYDHVYM